MTKKEAILSPRDRIREIETRISKTMGEDCYKLIGEIRRIKKLPAKARNSDKTAARIDRLEKRLRNAVQKREKRASAVPRPDYDENLPIVAKRDEIIDAIRNHPVVVVSGETGSGKTTQLPKFCLEAGRGVDGVIGCTQPRRIAAITVANRIAEELGEKTGESVGYKIRFTDKSSPSSYIKLMTDGILLAETQSDRFLNEYDTIIVDEAHERSLNIDFTLGILKTLVRRRKDLKLIITSATIDTEKFSRAFDNAPVIEVSGRMFPVDVLYEPPAASDDDDAGHVDAAVRAVEKLQRERPYGGDVLVFMPTEADIRETCELLEGRDFTGVTVMPLFARLSAGEQSRVFSSIRGRKIIVATNVAETSITIPGIKFVVDTGLARILQYSPRTRTTALPVAPISRSSADQRKGRCGRVQNGVCIRLYSEEDYENRPRFTPPEILRSNLAEVILRMISLRLGEIADFPFIDPPSAKHIQDGYDLLLELGAIAPAKGKKRSGEKYRLTDRGRIMARMPLDPRLSRMLLEARENDCLDEITIIAAALSIQDPRERPTEKQAEADAKHAKFTDPESDFAALLNIWRRYHEKWSEVKTQNQMRKYCKENFLSFKRMREWRDVRHQIRSILEETVESGLWPVASGESPATNHQPPTTNHNPQTAIHQSILSGFLSNIAVKKEKQIFTATKGRTAMIFPGSGLFKKPPEWIVAAEMVETSRLFARTAAAIDPGWLEALGGDLCKYAYLNPRWNADRGEVMADEQVSLFGLIFEPGRTRSFGPVDPERAADIFVQSALVEGEIRKPFGFLKHNRKQIAAIRDMEDRLRRRDLLVSEAEIFRFYRDRLPDIYDTRSLAQYLKKHGGDKFLRMRRDDLLNYDPDKGELGWYPQRLSLGNTAFPCEYHFEPGEAKDGVTVKIPSSQAPSILPESLEWLVPGLFREKVTALIKGLPKEYRKRLVPVTDTVDRIVRDMKRSDASLITSMGEFIARNLGVQIPASAWPVGDLPDHLKMRIAVVGPRGEELRAGREPDVLYKAAPKGANTDAYADARKQWERDGLIDWDFGDLPDSVTLKGGNGRKWTVYPGLKPSENGDGADLRLFEDFAKADRTHPDGVAALYRRRFSDDIKFLKKSLSLPGGLKSPAQYFGGPKAVETALLDSVVDELFRKNIRAEAAFRDHGASAKDRVLPAGRDRLQATSDVLTAYDEARSTLYEMELRNRGNERITAFLAGLRTSLARLVPENFLALYDTDRLGHIERYISAIAIRARRALVSFEKDQTKAGEVKVHVDHLNRMLETLSPSTSDDKRKALEDYHWLIEEYRVSLFAQELRTPVKVSPKRLETKRAEIERMA